MVKRVPYIEVEDSQPSCWEGWDNIGKELKTAIARLNQKKVVIAIECYHGTYADINLDELKRILSPNATCRAKDIYKSEHDIRNLEIKYPNSINGTSKKVIGNYFDQHKLAALKKNIAFIEEGTVLIHGIGASEIWDPDVLIYSDLSKWEVLQRLRRNDISNVGIRNESDPLKLKHSWSYLIDWPICDRIKAKSIGICHYFLETNNWKKPKMATGDIVRRGYEKIYTQPFFNAPFFDPGLWEPTEDISFEWIFNCNLEKNNVLLKIGESLFETPSINLIFYNPSKLLGQMAYRRFGSEMPIRFNFIDTLDEKDLNIYAYPGKKDLQEKYRITSEQLELYYVVENKKGSTISAGLKRDTSIKFMEEASSSATTAREKKQVISGLASIPVKQHNYMVIPNNTMHTKGEKTMILHISTVTSILERKLFNSDIDDSASQSQFLQMTTQAHQIDSKKLNESLDAQISKKQDISIIFENNDYVISRYWITQETTFDTVDKIQVVNLVDGKKISVAGDFKTIEAHRSETFVIPAALKSYTIKPVGEVCILIATINSSFEQKDSITKY